MFPYIGGKSHHINWLDSVFPEQYNTFVEVFGGAGWVSWRSKSVANSTTRIYNDRNPMLANAYECFRTQPQQLLEKMNSVPTSDLDLYRSYQTLLFTHTDWENTPLGDIELAQKYLYIETQSFSGNTLSANSTPYFTDVASNGKYPSKYNTLKKKLSNPKICQRLSEITRVENLDCCEVIAKYDSPDTFFYVDPPYYKLEKYYSQGFPTHKHWELAETLKNISGRFALSYYEFDELYKMYPPSEYAWHHQSVYKASGTRGSGGTGTEIVVMNYEENRCR